MAESLPDFAGEAHAPLTMTEALAEASHLLWTAKDEDAVVACALDSVHALGFDTGMLFVDGAFFLIGPTRHDPRFLAAAERLYGTSIGEIRIERAPHPHIDAIFDAPRALFIPDFHAFTKDFHPPPVAALLREVYPVVAALNAPVFVDGAPFAVFSVHGPTMTAASAATIALFARQIGGAIENVRHHRRAAERVAELARLQGELIAQERLAVLGEAAAVVAHEVRNPLGAILNAVAVLKRSPEDSRARASAVQMVEEEAMRLDAMVRDLLNVARPLEPRLRPVRLRELVERLVSEFSERSAHPGDVELSLGTEGADEVVLADVQLLQLALENLLRNAVQASPPGATVRVTVAGVTVVVEDEGPGIPETDAPRVFEPFFTTRATGTGLGLAIVRRIVVAHGGEVKLGPRAGGGARFAFSLPRPGST